MPKKLSGPTRYVTYARCSSDDQAQGDFTTIDAQRSITAQYVASLGGTVTAEYFDEGKSGTNLNRPGYKALLADAQAGKFDAVSISYMSRLGRGNAFVIAEHELSKLGVRVVMARETYDDSLAGYITKSTTTMMDGLYPRMVSQWTKTKQQSMVKQGFHTGGITPFAYLTETVSDGPVSASTKAPPKRLVPNPEQAPFVAAAFVLFLSTSSFTRTQEYLNGISDRRWTLNTTINLLQRETYTGVQAFGAWRNEVAHPPIVSRETWEAVQDIIASRPRQARRDRAKGSLPFYLRGCVYCAACGNRLTPAGHHGARSRVVYYECLSDTRRQKPCPVKRVNADSLHEVVLEEIRRGVEHPTRLRELIREAVKQVPAAEKTDGELTAIARLTREIDKKIKNLMGIMEAGGAGVRSLISRLQELEDERARLVEEGRKLEFAKAETHLQRPDVEEVQALWGRFLRLWRYATEEERGRLMPLLVERVDMTEKERGICRLLFSADTAPFGSPSTSDDVLVNSTLGAGVGLEPTTSGL